MMLEEAEEGRSRTIFALRGLVNKNLEDLVAGLNLNFKHQIQYSLLSPGKRLRPIMLLLSAQAVGGEIETSLPLALSVEALHAATLVHDDVIDQDQSRRGVPTVQKRWSVGTAILVGDVLFLLSIEQAASYGPRIVQMIAETGLSLCDGQSLEASVPLTTITEGQYFAKIRGKSASLFKCAAECGALAGGGTQREVGALAEFGERFGLAYQIRDDIEDLVGDTSMISSDIRNRIPTLPTIHLYREGDSRTRRLLERIFSGDGSIADAKEISTQLERRGSVLYCEQRIVENLEAACNALSVLKPSESRDQLTDIFRMILPLKNIPKV